jgi:3-oxoacyl-[acyl-carrier protein] reductase
MIKVKDGKIEKRMSLAEWQAVIDVNLTGVFLCGREAATKMIEQGNPGVIINISSVSRAGNMGQTNYSGRQGRRGDHGRDLEAKEIARVAGIRCAAIAPQLHQTPPILWSPA